jgi:hypothetical protein
MSGEYTHTCKCTKYTNGEEEKADEKTPRAGHTDHVFFESIGPHA